MTEVNDFSKKIKYIIADTTAFVQNAPLQELTSNVVTCEEVVNEITNKRQLRRLVVLPYDLEIKEVFPENIKIVTEFSKKTGDYPSLSATDIKVIALTYQLEKENVGIEHLRTEPLVKRSVNIITKDVMPELRADVVGFYLPGKENKLKYVKNQENELEKSKEIVDKCNSNAAETTDVGTIGNNTNSIAVKNESNTTLEEESQLLKETETLAERFETLEVDASELDTEITDLLVPVLSDNEESIDDFVNEDVNEDDDFGWITPSNIQTAKKQIDSKYAEEKAVTVACMTTDFAMQNVLKQMNLNVAALDGRIIKQLRTFILRCYSCFNTTSNMTKVFCPKCGNKTLKRVGVSVNKDGKEVIHINARKPLTARGKKYSLPRVKGGKHSNNPHLVEDQPFPDQRPSRLARTKNNPLDDDFIAGFSPFIMRDINSKSAQLKIRPHSEVKYWMRRNPNEVVKHKK